MLNLIKRTHWLRLGVTPVFGALRGVSLLRLRFPDRTAGAKLVVG